MARKKRQENGTGKKRETLREIYARYRREFTAADLQKYTEIEEGIPASFCWACGRRAGRHHQPAAQ